MKERLHYVAVDREGVSLDRFPDFLIAGPQRTGTTWLHAHLRLHPEVFLTRPKELFFFNHLKTPDHPRFRSVDLEWYLRHFRDPLWLFLAKTSICVARHGRLYRPRVRGEATASYAALDPDLIGEVTTLNPDIRVILMIRDPVERAWSHAKKDLARERDRKIEDVSEDELRRFFCDGYQRQCARYVENYDNWAARLQTGNVFVGLFDDMAARPEGLLLDILSFLGVRSDRRYVSGRVAQPINPTSGGKVPAHHRRFLEELLHDDLKQLELRFGLSWPR